MPPTIKERPILFSGPMVRAILEGRKSQTRRIVKPQPILVTNESEKHFDRFWEWKGQPLDRMGRDVFLEKCPYGKPGDRLWVKETWSPDAVSMYPCPKAWYRATDEETFRKPEIHDCPKGSRGNYADCLACWVEKNGPFRWRPSIHMPRRASRIFLEIVSVRVERLQDISDGDVFAEGIRGLQVVPDHLPQNLQGAYGALWESINGTGSWDANPYVWVIEFRRL